MLPQGQITRAKIILALDRGWTPTAMAHAQQVSAKSVHKWRNRYLEAGIDGLYDQPRSGRLTKLTEKMVKRVLKRSARDSGQPQCPQDGRGQDMATEEAAHSFPLYADEFVLVECS